MTTLVSCPHALLGSFALGEKARPRDRRIGARSVAAARYANGIEGLYDRYADDVFGLALWLLRSHEEAAETVQDTFVRLLSWGKPLNEIREPRGLLLRIARTAALDRIRKRRPLEPLPEESMLSSASESPEARAHAAEVSRALCELPVKQREALYLRFFVGLNFREIGKVSGVPTFTAASRCRLGLARLRKRMTR